MFSADDPLPVLDEFWRCEPIPGAGLWLPTALLHVHDARRFAEMSFDQSGFWTDVHHRNRPPLRINRDGLHVVWSPLAKVQPGI